MKNCKCLIILRQFISRKRKTKLVTLSKEYMQSSMLCIVLIEWTVVWWLLVCFCAISNKLDFTYCHQTLKSFTIINLTWKCNILPKLKHLLLLKFPSTMYISQNEFIKTLFGNYEFKYFKYCERVLKLNIVLWHCYMQENVINELHVTSSLKSH